MTNPLILLAVAAKLVWMDVDPAVLPGGNEPDDGLALVQAFHSDELEVRGVSIVFGNSPLAVGEPNGREIVERFGPEGLPVYRGASSRDELGQENDATRALAAALREEELTILALGPVTNVATVLKNHPELASRIPEIIAVAGRRPGQTFVLGEGGRPLMDMNFEYDDEGMQILLDSGVPIVLAPFEIATTAAVPEKDIERFVTTPEYAEFFAKPLRDYVNWYDDHFGVRAIFPFDTLAVAYLTSPEWIQCEALPIEIQTLPDDIKQGEEKPFLIVSRELKTEVTAKYCHTATDEFVPDLVDRLIKTR
jgi:inosine-uridine nucleoside N-ribohydrolase